MPAANSSSDENRLPEGRSSLSLFVLNPKSLEQCLEAGKHLGEISRIFDEHMHAVCHGLKNTVELPVLSLGAVSLAAS